MSEISRKTINSLETTEGGSNMNEISRKTINSLETIKEDSEMNIQAINNNLPANISHTLSALPEMRIPSDISCERDPITGLDILVRSENDGVSSVEILTYVKDNEELVLAYYDDDSSMHSPISEIFGEDDFFTTENTYSFELSEIEKLLENTDASVFFYMLELIDSFNFSKQDILKIFRCLTSVDIHHDDLFRALKRSNQDDIQNIFEIMTCGDALSLKRIINDLNDVPTIDKYDDDDYDGYFDDDDESIDDDYNDNGEE